MTTIKSFVNFNVRKATESKPVEQEVSSTYSDTCPHEVVRVLWTAYHCHGLYLNIFYQQYFPRLMAMGRFIKQQLDAEDVVDDL